MEEVVLAGFSFVLPELFLQGQSLPAVVVVLEEGLTSYPAPLCMGVMVLECPFQDPDFL